MLTSCSSFLAPGDRNLAALLGKHDGERIGAFGHSDGRAMSRPDLASGDRVRVQWKKASRGGNVVPLNNHCAIVQLAAGMKNRAQQVPGNDCIQRHAAFDKGAQADFPLDDDQRSSFVLDHLLHRQDDFYA